MGKEEYQLKLLFLKNIKNGFRKRIYTGSASYFETDDSLLPATCAPILYTLLTPLVIMSFDSMGKSLSYVDNSKIKSRKNGKKSKILYLRIPYIQ